MVSRNLDRSGREIDTRDLRAAPGKLQEIRAHATADLEQSLAIEIIEAHHRRHPRRIFLIAMSFDFVEKLARSEFMFAPINSTGGITAPLFARAMFFICCHDWSEPPVVAGG